MLVADHAVRTSALSSGLIPKPRSISVGETLITPITASPMNRAPLRDATNSGWRNRRRSSIGSLRRSSIAANSASEGDRCEERDCQRCRPVGSAFDQAGGQRCHRAGQGDRPGDIERAPRSAPRFGDGRRGRHQRGRADRLQPVAASPAQRGRQRSAEDRAKRDAAADGGAPHARRERPRSARRKRMPDQPETRGDDAGTGGALKEPSGDEHADCGGDRSDHARRRQQHRAPHEHAPAPEIIGERAGGQQRRGHPHAHGAEHPGLTGKTPVERLDRVADIGHDGAEDREHKQRRRCGDDKRVRRTVRGNTVRRFGTASQCVQGKMCVFGDHEPPTQVQSTNLAATLAHRVRSLNPRVLTLRRCSARTTNVRTVRSPARWR